MDEILPKLLVFPPYPPPQQPLTDAQYDEGVKAQIATLIRASEKSLVGKTAGNESFLDVIDPSLHPIAYAFILLAHAQQLAKGSKIVTAEALFEKTTHFLCQFDGRQMRYLGRQLDQILEVFVGLARDANQLYLAIAPFGQAILQLDPSGSVLTHRHKELVDLALESGDYGSAVAVLEKQVLYFPSSSNKVKFRYSCELNIPPSAYLNLANNHNIKFKYQDVLEYFLYSAMIFIGLERWEDALDYLESAITYPVRDGCVSKIMAEAYKKWILVGVLAYGKLLTAPKTVNASGLKHLQVIAKPYAILANIFESGTAPRLKSEAEHAANLWDRDGNLGLLRKVIAAYQKFQIRNLANVYSKITIPEVQNLTMSAETGNKATMQVVDSIIRNMISQGELQATLSKPTVGPSVLTFSPTGPVLSETDMQRELLEATHRIQILTNEIKQTDRNLTHEKDYVKWVQKQKKSNKDSSHGAAGAEMDWEGQEELMEGIF